MAARAFAKIPFKYNGQQLDRGQIVDLRGLPRDQQLLGLKYFVAYDPARHESRACETCGAKFISYSHLTDHKKKIDCLADQREITVAETAELLDRDPDKVKVEA